MFIALNAAMLGLWTKRSPVLSHLGICSLLKPQTGEGEIVKKATPQKARYTIEYKAGYRVVDNLTGQYVGQPMQSLGDAISEARLLNLKELHKQEDNDAR